jgi:hypothetical protein
MTSYVYLAEIVEIRSEHFGRKYYGASYKEGASPEELGVTYFSSSRKIKEIIKKYGSASVRFEIRRIFSDVYSCLRWESSFLRRIDARNNQLWLNEHNGDGKFYCKEHTEESRKKMSAWQRENSPLRGRKRPDVSEYLRNRTGGRNPNFGKKLSEETIKKMAAAQSTRTWRYKHTEEDKKKMGEYRKGKTLVRKEHTCPKCGLVGKGPNMKRWHFDNCRVKQ